MSGELMVLPPPGQYGLSAIVRERGLLTTSAALRKIAPVVENYFPPPEAATTAVPFALVRLAGPAAPDPDTLLLPSGGALSQLPLNQRLSLRAAIVDRFGVGFGYTDYEGGARVVAALTPADFPDAATVPLSVQRIFNYLQHSRFRLRPARLNPNNTLFTDNFDTDPAARWAVKLGTFGWDATNGEIDPGNAGRYCFRHSAGSPGAIDHEVQATLIANGTNGTGWAGAGNCRLNTAGAGVDDSDYHLEYEPGAGGTGNVYLLRTGTILATWATDIDASNWYTGRLAAEGAAGANVLLSFWHTAHGATKPADPGAFLGTVGSPTQTFTDTAAGRLDDADRDWCGLGGFMNATGDDPRIDYFRTQAIADRAGGGPAFNPATVARKLNVRRYV